MKKVVPPSELELQVLSVLWEQGPCTAREVLELLPDKKPRAYTTVLSVMQVMEKKGLLTHETQGKTHVYAPSVKRQQILGPFMKGLLKTVFSGRPSRVLQCLLEEEDCSQEELAALQQLLEEHETKPGN